MTNVFEGIHPILNHLIHLAPAIEKSFISDVIISISTLDTVIYQSESSSFGVANDSVGLKLTDQDPMAVVMRTKQRSILTLGKEYYGVAIRLTTVPIFDEQQHVIGSMAISRNIKDQSELLEISQTFATSTEQLTTSSSELSHTASSLFDFIKDVNASQEILTAQMMESTKILDMINNVAKNTRILGFNAGIEAARSGEHGRGFAVVAKEITKLADQSADSVNEIRTLLQTMRNMVSDVTKTMQSTQSLTETQVVATTEIAQALENLSSVAEKIDALAQKL